MPRDASGNYTLPAGNPVVTDTVIDSTWANNTMDDIATVLQDSLSRSGDGGMLVPFENADGTVGAPGITFTNEPTSGIYRAAANDVRVSIAGVVRARFRANAANPFQIHNGTSFTDVLYAALNATITGNWTFTSTTFAVTAASTFVGNVGITGALTATSYGGITEANLVDKSAAETITGDWTFTATNFAVNAAVAITGDVAITGALTATSYGGITEANLVAKNASETITGTWTLDGAVTGADFGTGGKVKDGTDTARPIGFNVMPAYEIDAADDFDLAHNAFLWHTDGASTIAFTCVEDANIPQGATYVIVNRSTAGVQTIEEGAGVTLVWFDGITAEGDTGDRTLASGGVATVYKYSDTVFYIWGNGLS